MNENSPTPLLTWKRVWLILVVIFAAWILVSARAALTPLVVSVILAYLLHPLVELLERRKIPRTLAVLIVLFALALSVFILWTIIAPLVQEQVVSFARKLPHYINVMEKWVTSVLERLHVGPPERIREVLIENLAVLAQLPMNALRTGGTFLLQTTSGLLSIALSVVYLALTPVITFYLLRDLEKFSGTFYDYIHPAYRAEVRKRLDRLDELLGSFIKGQLTVGLILMVLYSFGFFLVGVPLWLLLGLLTGLVAMFPYVEWIVALPIVLLFTGLQYQDWFHILTALLVFGVVSPLAGTFIVPRVLGNRVGLHPVVVIAAIMIGGELLGFVGILLAVPLAAAVKVGLEAMYDFYIA